MQVTDCTAKTPVSSEADPGAVIHALETAQAEIAALNQQLDWFKRQLFGRKSEKRLIEHPDQLDFGALLGETAPPVEVIELSAPELEGPEAEQYEVIDYKVSHRLAQRPGSYVVLEYRRPVLRHKPSSRLAEVPAPPRRCSRAAWRMSACWRGCWWTSFVITCRCTASINGSRMVVSP